MGTNPNHRDTDRRALAQRIIGRFIPECSRLARTTNPGHLTLLADELGVKSVATRPLTGGQDLHSGVDAMLVPVREGYSVVINEKAPHTRQRYSLAHELGHIMLLVAQPPTPTPPSPTRFRSSGSAMENTKAEERLCDAIAAELLMPEKMFTAAVAESGRSLAQLPRLASRFGTSLTATAIRYWELLPEPCHLIKWRSPSDGKGDILPAWQMRNEVPGLSLKPIKREEFRTVRQTWSTLTKSRSHESLLVEYRTRGRTYVRTMTLETESIGFGSRHNRSALSAVYLGRTPSDDQHPIHED